MNDNEIDKIMGLNFDETKKESKQERTFEKFDNANSQIQNSEQQLLKDRQRKEEFLAEQEKERLYQQKIKQEQIIRHQQEMIVQEKMHQERLRYQRELAEQQRIQQSQQAMQKQINEFTQTNNHNVNGNNVDLTVESNNIKPNMFSDGIQTNMQFTQEINTLNHNGQFDEAHDNIHTTKLKGKRYMMGIIFWSVVLILSILCGIDAIFVFVDKFNIFLDKVEVSKNWPIDDSSGEFAAGWDATKAFFYSLLFIFEALLFVFFILFSIFKIIKNQVHWSKYKKSTDHKNFKKRIEKYNLEEQQLRKLLFDHGVSTSNKEYNNSNSKKHLKEIKKEIKKLENQLKNVKETRNDIEKRTDVKGLDDKK